MMPHEQVNDNSGQHSLRVEPESQSSNRLLKHFTTVYLTGTPSHVDYFISNLPIILILAFLALIMGFSPEMSLGLSLLFNENLLEGILVIILSGIILVVIAIALTEWELLEKAHVRFYQFYRYVLGGILAIETVLWLAAILINLNLDGYLFFVVIFSFSTLTRLYPAFTVLFFDYLQLLSFVTFLTILAMVHAQKIYRHLVTMNDQPHGMKHTSPQKKENMEELLKSFFFSSPFIKKMPFGVRILTWTLFLEQTLLMPYVLRALFIDLQVFSTELFFILGVLAAVLTWLVAGFLLWNGFSLISQLQIESLTPTQKQMMMYFVLGLTAFLLTFNLIGFYPSFSLTMPSYLTVSLHLSTSPAVQFFFLAFRLLLPKVIALVLITWTLYKIVQADHLTPNTTLERTTHHEDMLSSLPELLNRRPSRTWLLLANSPLLAYFLIKIIAWGFGLDLFWIMMLQSESSLTPTIGPWLFFYLPEALILSAALVNTLLARKGYPSLYWMQGVLLLVLAMVFFHHAEGWHFQIIPFITLVEGSIFGLPILDVIPNLVLYWFMASAFINFHVATTLNGYHQRLASLTQSLESSDISSDLKEKIVHFIQQERSRTFHGLPASLLFVIILSSLWPLRYHSFFVDVVIAVSLLIILLPGGTNLLPFSSIMATIADHAGGILIEIVIIAPFLWAMLITAYSLHQELKLRPNAKQADNKFKWLVGMSGISVVLALFGFEFLFSPAALAMIILPTWFFLERIRIRNRKGEPLPPQIQANMTMLKIIKWYERHQAFWLVKDENERIDAVSESDLLSKWLSVLPDDDIRKYDVLWTLKNGHIWNVALIGNVMLLAIFILLLAVVEFITLNWWWYGGIILRSINDAFFILLLLLFFLFCQVWFLRMLHLKSRASSVYYLFPVIIGILFFLSMMLAFRDLFVLGFLLSSYLIGTNAMLASRTSEIISKHEKVINEENNRMLVKTVNLAYNHLPHRISISLQLLLLYHLPAIMVMLLAGIWYGTGIITASLMVRYYLHGSAVSLLNGVLHVIDFCILLLAASLLRKDFKEDHATVVSQAYLLSWVLVSKMAVVSLGMLLNVLANVPPATIVINAFLLTLLGVSTYYCYQLSAERISPTPDFKTQERMKSYVTMSSTQLRDEHVPDASKEVSTPTPPREEVIAKPARPTVSKQSLLIKEAMIPPPTPEEIQWAEVKAHEYVLGKLKEQGYIELDKLPTHVGRVAVDFKKILTRMQLEGRITLLWGSDGRVVYDDEYLETEMLRYLSRNRSLTAAELAQKFNLEVETVSFKLKRWFVDGRIN